MCELVLVDGSRLEGGGQIVRNAISLSAILGVPVKVTNIRAGRTKPGLRAQHLKGVELVAKMCNAELTGAAIGSMEIEFKPGKIEGGQYAADTKTAGSISLLLQIALPVALFAPSAVRLDLRGGTNVERAPQIDYMTEVFAYVLRRFNADFSLTIHRRGYYPRGGGRVTAEIKPVVKLLNVELLERGEVTAVQGWSFVAGSVPVKVAYEITSGARAALRSRRYDVRVDSYKEHRSHAPDLGLGVLDNAEREQRLKERRLPLDNCLSILLVSESSTGCVLGSEALGKRGVTSVATGAAAGEAIGKELDCGTCVDTHAQDQIILYMALAAGHSVVRCGEITMHTKTAIHIAERVARVKFTIRPEGEQNFISCTGVGVINKLT